MLIATAPRWQPGAFDITLRMAVKEADMLEKSGVAPWDREPGEPVGTPPNSILACGELALQHEREVCAQIADEMAAGLLSSNRYEDGSGIDACQTLAKIIRARD